LSQYIVVALVGFAAQLVDGAIGMAFGVIGTTFLLGIGLSPATASASMHMTEMVTTAVSGASHWRMGNVDWRLVGMLAVPGCVGGAIGAYLLTTISGDTVRPFVNAFLATMGIFILWRALQKRPIQGKPPGWAPLLGLGGGFLDAIGGGGWGPMVTSTLVGHGTTPRIAIGSVNLAEFFVTVTISATFFLALGIEHWPIILALIVGGALAAPLGAYAARHFPERVMMALVGVVVLGLSLRSLAIYFL
jgi:uncharacterized membrane protein YfcA